MPRHSHPRRDPVGEGETKTVYQTLKKTFDGPIAGYTTLAPSPTGGFQNAASVTAEVVPEATSFQELVKNALEDPATDIPSAIIRPTETDGLETGIAKATGEATVGPGREIIQGDKGPSPTIELSASYTAKLEPPFSPQSSSAASPPPGSDNSGVAAKAGIALGVLAGVFLIGLLIFVAISRRKKRKAEERDREKSRKAMEAFPVPPMKDRPNPNAARRSLRPVTQFFSHIGVNNSAIDQTAMSQAPAGRQSPRANPFERSETSQSTHPANPFGNQAERSSTSQSIHNVNPFGNHAERPVSPMIESHSMHTLSRPTSAVSDVTAFEAHDGRDASNGKRQQSMYADGRNVDLTLHPSRAPPSPAGSQFSMQSVSPGSVVPPSPGALAIAAAGGPANTSVHRVQLDFKPTLEDEMGLRAGDLVRLIHEYDDGWALCIRLDRSQQGVVPRTCLSTRPVKPRQPGRPESPASPRSPGLLGPRYRPQSPSGLSHQFHPSAHGAANTVQRPRSPPANLSFPVPGQAL